jgi:intracellular sulfur oxidation DsrE/DsrF family protein
MTSSSDAPSPRRAFLGKVAGSAAVLAAGSMIPAELRAMAPSARPHPPGDWDMSWVDRITGEHRQVFDCPEINEATVLHQARVWLGGFNEVYGTTDADMHGVLVIRHKAIPMAVNDVMWAKYKLGKLSESVDPASGKPAERNPFLNANGKEGDKHTLLWPDGGLDTLMKRGQTVLACNMALHFMSGLVAEKARMQATDVYTEMRANLVPGVTLMPSGIFAVTRALQAGCGYLYAG